MSLNGDTRAVDPNPEEGAVARHGEGSTFLNLAQAHPSQQTPHVRL